MNWITTNVRKILRDVNVSQTPTEAVIAGFWEVS
jgi:hypothetical protein